MYKIVLSLIIVLTLTNGCSSRVYDKDYMNNRVINGDLSLKQINKGMKTGEIIEILGNPSIKVAHSSIVEKWIYKNIPVNVVQSCSPNGVDNIILSQSQGKKRITLTITFNGNIVADFKYL
jgi:outer membrane protein assembly factor BamE (lipoprotein component of BamABCDE complex)